MGYDQSAPRLPVNVNLNADLVQQGRSGIANFSAHVEALLAADLAQRQVRAEAEKIRTERAIDALSALYEAHGALSEEMQNL